MELIGKLDGPLPERCLLPKHYQLKPDNPHTHCKDCGCQLHQQRLKTRFPVSIFLGEPKLVFAEMRCPGCGREYSIDGLKLLLPPHSQYGFDVMTQVGVSRYLEHHQAGEIRQYLKTFFGLLLPESTINHLARRFLDALALAHKAHSPQLKEWMQETRGGYILHLDGTCEAGTSVCFVAVDGESQLLLLSTKIPSENVKDIESFLRECVSRFGLPLATVRDLSENIRLARDNALGHIPDFICQYHLLDNIGEKLCASLSNKLNKALRRHRIKSSLSHNARQLQNYYRQQTPIPQDQLNAFLEDPAGHAHLNTTQLRRQLHFQLIAWVQDYTHDLSGEYFPFDQPVLAFYRRCRKMLLWLDTVLLNTQLPPLFCQPFERLRDRFAPTRDDPEIVDAALALQTAFDQFQELRSVLRLQVPKNQSLLRQHPPVPTGLEETLTIEDQFRQYRQKLDKEIANKAQDPLRSRNARKIADTLDKYRDHLFGHVIQLPGRKTPIIVSRTNSTCEHLFARRKRTMRRQTGNTKLAKRLDTAHPAEALVENLKNPDYLQILCGGHIEQLPAYLACHWTPQDKTDSVSTPIPVHNRIQVRKTFIRSDTFFSQAEQAIKSLVEIPPDTRKTG